MELKDSKNNLFLLTIVAIVAIVAIVIMIATTASRSYNLSEDTTGQAAKASASAELVTEGKTTTVKTSPIATEKPICKDSDGGKNYYVKGYLTTNDPTPTAKMVDYCRNFNSSTLVEYYCDRNKPASEDYLCENGCENGACKNETVPVCGNGEIEEGELCDGTNLGNMQCTDIGSYVGGILSCNNDCTFDTSNCDAGYGYCGDNVINNYFNEQCDGSEWGNIASCTDFGFTGGTLTCNNYNETNRCVFDTSLCTGLSGGFCGDQIIQKGEQCEMNRPLTLECTDFDSFTGGTLACDYSTCQYDISGCEIAMPAECGNGIIEPAEQCDDGNSNNADQCNNQCMLTTCGDGIVQWPNGLRVGGIYQLNSWGFELCDDGNTNNNDACDNNCTVGRSCVDTDNGINYYIFGTVIFTNGSYSYNYTDSCGGSILYERFCTGTNNPATNTTICPYGCSGGRCLNQTVTLKPDLIVEDIVLTDAYNNTLPNNFSVNTSVKIFAKIKNIGNISVNVSSFSNNLFIYNVINTTVQCQPYIAQIAPGQSFMCKQLAFISLGPGSYNMVVRTDYLNQISEINENNNVRAEILYVYSADSSSETK